MASAPRRARARRRTGEHDRAHDGDASALTSARKKFITPVAVPI